MLSRSVTSVTVASPVIITRLTHEETHSVLERSECTSPMQTRTRMWVKVVQLSRTSSCKAVLLPQMPFVLQMLLFTATRSTGRAL